MADVQIREALEAHLYAMADSLPTIWQGRQVPSGFDSNKPHQKAFVLRAKNQSQGLREKTTLHSGIFQVNLCYPSITSATLVEARGVALQEHFKGQILERDGVKVIIRGKPDIHDPISVSPYVVPVSIRYQTIF